MKRTIISASAILSIAFAGFAAEDVVYPDTIKALSIVHPNGWSKLLDAISPAVSSIDVAGAAGEDATIKLIRGIQPTAGADPWPEATILGAMFEDKKETEYSLKKLQKVVFTYTVTSFPEGADGVSLAIGSAYSTSIEDAGWAKFHAVLTTGSKAVGTKVSDTLSLTDFIISYSSDKYKEGTTLASAEAAEYLAKTNSFGISVESEKWTAEQSLELKVHEVQFIGESGLLTDMKIDPNSIDKSKMSKKLNGSIVTGISNKSITLLVPATGAYEISLISANGRLLEKKSAQLSANTAKEVSISKTTSGVYFVKIEGNGINMTEKVSLK